MRVAWPAADVGGIPPEGGIEAAYKRQLAEAADPAALRAEINARIESVRGPIGPLNRFQIEEMIDPRDTRRLVCEWVADAYRIVSPAGAAGAARAAVPAVDRRRRGRRLLHGEQRAGRPYGQRCCSLVLRVMVLTFGTAMLAEGGDFSASISTAFLYVRAFGAELPAETDVAQLADQQTISSGFQAQQRLRRLG